MRGSCIAILLAFTCVTGKAETLEALKDGSGSRFAESSSPTEALISDAVDASSRKLTDKLAPGNGETLLKGVRAGEGKLIQKTIDESPELRRMMEETERNKTWNDVYEARIVAAAVASWGNNMRAGYIKGTAAAYATFETAPPVVNVIAAIPLWVAGVVYGASLGLLASAVTGHL